MFKPALIAGGVALAALTLPAAAQTPPATMTADQVGASPMTGVSDSDYVKMAADSDMFEIKSSQIALSKSKRADVKGFAHKMIEDHTKTTDTLKAALKNDDRKITMPTMPTSDTVAKLQMLRKTPSASFDQVYLQQQLEGHQKAWALHEGYATDGTDPALKQVATSAVPIIEQHLQMVKALQGGSSPAM